MTLPAGLSIFIPVFNEEAILEKNIKRLHTHMESLGHPFEIIVGSNGSYDETLRLLEGLTFDMPELRFFHFTDKGVGKAFVKGARLARYPRILSVDMDLSIDLDFIENAYRLLCRVHVVVGSKKTGNQKRSFLRKAGSLVFIWCAAGLLGLGYSDYSIAAKAYRKETILPYLPFLDSQTFYVALILFYAANQKKTIVEIPVACRDTRPSRFNLIHEGFYKFSKLFKLFLSHRFLRKYIKT